MSSLTASAEMNINPTTPPPKRTSLRMNSYYVCHSAADTTTTDTHYSKDDSPTSVSIFPIEKIDESIFWNHNLHKEESRNPQEPCLNNVPEDASEKGDNQINFVRHQKCGNVHPLKDVFSNSRSSSGSLVGSWKKKKKGESSDLAKTLIKIRKSRFFAPFMFAKPRSRHEKSKATSSVSKTNKSEVPKGDHKYTDHEKPSSIAREDRVVNSSIKSFFSASPYTKDRKVQLLQGPPEIATVGEVGKKNENPKDSNCESLTGGDIQVPETVRIDKIAYMVDNFKENIGEHSLAKESAEAKFNPRNRSSILHGQARHLEEILFNSNFDYETKVSIRGQGNSRHNNSIKNIYQDSSSQDDEFRAIRGILLNMSECESKKSLDTFTDSASDCSTMGDVALDEIQSQMPSRWFEFDENGLYYDSDPGELKILRQQHEDIFEEAPCEEALLGTGCETFKSFGMDISGQKFEGGVHLLSKGNFSDE